MQLKSTLFNNRLHVILLLSFSSGLPFMLTGSTLQAWLSSAGVDLKLIGVLSLLGLPYILKFLWAPLFDYWGLQSLGRRRTWILIAQLGLALSLWFIAHCTPNQELLLLLFFAFLIAFFSASQDIAIDAYRTDILIEQERGIGASYFVFAYRMANLISGGFALIAADHFGFKITYECFALCIILLMLPTLLAPRPVEITTKQSLFKTTQHAWRNLLTRENIFLLFLFIFCYKLGDALVQSLLTPFLLGGLGFSLTEVGVAYKFVSFVATVGGAFVGGLLLLNINIYSALLWFGLAQAFSNLCFVVLAFVGKNFILMSCSVFIENFCSGMSTAAFLAFLMSLCDLRYTAGQYALLSAIASLPRVLIGSVAGWMVTSLGWLQFFWIASLLSIPGILLLIFIKEKVNDVQAATE